MPRARFSPPAPRTPKRETEVEFPVQGGLHTGISPHRLPRGFSPDLRNFVPREDGYVLPRSGLSQPETYDFNGAVLGASEVWDVNGRLSGLAQSDRSVSFLHVDNETWSDLSYIAGSQSWHSGNLSGQTSDYFRTATIYDPNLNGMLAVFSNNTDSLKFLKVEDSSTTFSDFTWPDSIDSTHACADLVSINDRLLLFNTLSSDSTRYPNRVMWSARGNPRSFLVADGAGAEDLADMKGEGQAVVRFREYILLFTEVEIWRGIPTLDAYAFRFERVVDNVGCPFPRTIVTTPNGVMFLGRDLEVYATDGSSVVPVGAQGGAGPSRIQRKLQQEFSEPERAWSTYNSTNNRYELYYVASDVGGDYPKKALFLSLQEGSWWPQEFTLQLTSGVDLVDPTDITNWDQVEATFDATESQWNSTDIIKDLRRVNVFTSLGSTLRFRSDTTTDDGDAIDVRWRSPGVNANGLRKAHLKEVWVSAEADSSSSASIYVGSARLDNSFANPTAISIGTSGNPIHVPVWQTETSPAFEIRLNDGGTPRFTSFTALVQDASKF